MADKKITNKDLVQGNPFQPTQDQAVDFKKIVDSLNASLNKTSDELKEMLKQGQKLASSRPTSGYDNIKQVEQGIRRVEQASEALSKNERDRIKLRERLNNLTAEGAQENARLREEIRRQNKELRDNAKAALDSNDAYQVLTKQFRDAQKELKSVAAEFGVNSKQAKAAEKELRKVAKRFEEVNQQARDGRVFVGQYERATKKLSGTLKLIAASGVVAALTGLVDAFKANDEGADTFSQGLGRVTLTLGAIVKSLFSVGKALKEGKGFLDAFSEGFENFGDGLDKAFTALDEQVRLTREYRRIAASTSIVIAELSKQRELLMSVTDDSNTGLVEQFKLLTDLEEVTIELGEQQELLAKQQLAIAQERFKTNKESTANLEALKEAEKALIEVQKERLTNEIDINRRRREIISDLSELELDILIDGADNQKTINERIISDATVSLERRRKILEDTQKFLDSSLQGQIFSLEESQNRIRSLEAQDLESRNKILRDRINLLSSSEKAEKENADKILQAKNQLLANENQIAELRKDFTIDINKLLQESDFDRLNAEISNLGLSEKLQTRLLEIIRERKTAVQDLTEANRDLSKSERESVEVQNDITLQAEALQKLIKKRVRFQTTLEELEEARRKQEIENITKRLETVEEGSEEELKLRQELLNKLIDQEAEAGRKIIEQRVKIQQAASEVLTGFSQKFFEGELNRLDEQLEAVRNRQNEIRELSQRNVQSAGDALAFQQRREAELEREREQERKRQEKSKLLFAILDTVSAKAAAGDPEPLKSAALDTAFLRLIVENFPSFAVGTEALGKVNKPVDNQGGRVIIAHENERILTSSQNDSLDGHPSNDMLVAGYNIGKAYINGGVPASSGIAVGLANAIISGLEKVNNTIDRKPVHTGTQVDVIKGIVTDIIESEGVKIKYHQKYTRKH